MRLTVVLGAYVLFNAYVALRTMRFIRHNLSGSRGCALGWGVMLVYAALALMLVLAAVLPEGMPRRALQRSGNYFEGFSIYLLFAYVLLELICLALRLAPRGRGIVEARGIEKLALCIGLCVYGGVHSSQLTVKHYDVTVNKACPGLEKLRVVLIADTHLGYSVGAARIEDMVDKVNAQDADLILFAGDIFDNSTETMDDPAAVKAALSSMKSRLGTYACWGNHDIDESLFSGFAIAPDEEALRSREMETFVRDCGIKVLADEAVLVEDALWLVGRKDYANDGAGTQNRASLSELMEGISQDRPVLVMDHEPRFLKENADAGVDVLFSGHTHDGQFFPLNLTGHLVWKNPSGMRKIGNMTSIVTSGVGVYGPDIRVGTDADVSVVDICFD